MTDRFYITTHGLQAFLRDRQSTDTACGGRKFIERIAKVLNACDCLSDEDLDGWVTRLVIHAQRSAEPPEGKGCFARH